MWKLDGIDIESCGDNRRRAARNRPIAQTFHPARSTFEGSVLQPLNATRIAAATARAKRARPLAEPEGLTSVGKRVVTDVRHDSNKLSLLKRPAPGADLEGAHERPIPAHSLTNDALEKKFIEYRSTYDRGPPSHASWQDRLSRLHAPQ